MDIKLNLSYSASIMLDAFTYYTQYYAGIIGLGLARQQTGLLFWTFQKHLTQSHTEDY